MAQESQQRPRRRQAPRHKLLQDQTPDESENEMFPALDYQDDDLPLDPYWAEVQAWFRAQPIMEGFFSGRHAGRKRLPLLMEMYRKQADALGVNIASQGWVLRAPYSAAVIGVVLGAILGLVFSQVSQASTQHLASGAIGGVPWWIAVPAGAIFFAMFGYVSGLLWRGLMLFNRVTIPLTVQQFDDPGSWCPTYRGITTVPRLAFVAERGKFYYGPLGGGVLTATHIRVASYPEARHGVQGTPNIRSCPPTVVYELPPQERSAFDTPARAQRALVVATRRASAARPKGRHEKKGRLLSKENLYTGAALVGGAAAMLVIAGRVG